MKLVDAMALAGRLGFKRGVDLFFETQEYTVLKFARHGLVLSYISDEGNAIARAATIGLCLPCGRRTYVEDWQASLESCLRVMIETPDKVGTDPHNWVNYAESLDNNRA